MAWESKSLDELGEVRRGKSKHRPRDAAHLYGGDYPFVQTGDVKHSGLYVTQFTQTYSEAGLTQSKLWPKGTLCITIAANIADTAILSFDACFPDSIIGFNADPKKSDVRFVKYLMDTLKKRFKQFSQGAAQDNLSLEKLISLKFPVPDLKTQEKIAEILSSYDELINVNNKKIALLEESARLLYKEWFVHLRFPGYEKVKIVNCVPNGWKRESIFNIWGIRYGKNLSTDKLIENGEFPVYGADKIIGYFSEFNTEDKVCLVTCRGAGCGNVRRTQFAKSFVTNNSFLFVPKERVKGITIPFTFNALINLNLSRLNTGAAQPQLTLDGISSVDILMPPDSLVKRFGELTAPMFDHIDRLGVMNKQLALARDILLPRLMNGDIEI